MLNNRLSRMVRIILVYQYIDYRFTKRHIVNGLIFPLHGMRLQFKGYFRKTIVPFHDGIPSLHQVVITNGSVVPPTFFG